MSVCVKTHQTTERPSLFVADGLPAAKRWSNSQGTSGPQPISYHLRCRASRRQRNPQPCADKGEMNPLGLGRASRTMPSATARGRRTRRFLLASTRQVMLSLRIIRRIDQSLTSSKNTGSPTPTNSGDSRLPGTTTGVDVPGRRRSVCSFSGHVTSPLR